jgi:hypothetical protein
MSERMNTGMRLREASVAKLDAAAVRMGDKSRAFVVEVLIGLYADRLDANTQIPAGVFPPDTRERKLVGRSKNAATSAKDGRKKGGKA